VPLFYSLSVLNFCAMKRLIALLVAGAICVFVGCDSEKIASLEKKNKELQAQLDKQKLGNLESQAKCSRDAKVWFSEQWQRDKSTLVLDYKTHYNEKMNRCFILVEFNYDVSKSGSWVNDLSLWDVYENGKYGQFSESHIVSTNSHIGNVDRVVVCNVPSQRCKTASEFDALLSQYMNN
jgi:hypothetical protein